jgi:hypothetical protein
MIVVNKITNVSGLAKSVSSLSSLTMRAVMVVIAPNGLPEKCAMALPLHLNHCQRQGIAQE